ncbi:MAG: lipoate--protein ligase family protein [Myxococcales bacterium]|nr:lipoate--protein ligase family protein [Myxococcales bacterium]
MAVDETLLASLRTGGRPTLRLYGWSRPSLSLGYRAAPAPGDRAGDWIRRADAHGIDLVRRPTGGGAVLHCRDLSYSVAAARGTAPIPDLMWASYEWIRSALLEALRGAGIEAAAAHGDRDAGAEPLCFKSATGTEIEAAGLKLVGSAQRRTRWGFLQHGSIRLRDDSELYRALFGTGPPPALPETGHTDPALLRRAIVVAFEHALGGPIERAGLSASELDQVRRRERLRSLDRLCAPSISSSGPACSADNAR